MAGGETKEMRRLLRLPRYFTAEEDQSRCFTCGEPGHESRECPQRDAMRLQRPCHICGGFGHESRECPENLDNLCFRCHKPGHMARDCPSRGNNNSTVNNGGNSANNDGRGGVRGGSGENGRVGPVCMTCGREGHDYRSCRRGYDPRDLELIECYVCGQRGHLCCADLACGLPEEVSCYSCGEPGHTGEVSRRAGKCVGYTVASVCQASMTLFLL